MVETRSPIVLAPGGATDTVLRNLIRGITQTSMDHVLESREATVAIAVHCHAADLPGDWGVEADVTFGEIRLVPRQSVSPEDSA